MAVAEGFEPSDGGYQLRETKGPSNCVNRSLMISLVICNRVQIVGKMWARGQDRDQAIAELLSKLATGQ